MALAKLTLLGANLLLLDEPTNHLDIDSQEVLQTVLEDFTGTILLVSHDRYLVDALATQIWEMTAGELIIYDGDYQGFLRDRKRSPREAGAKANAKGSASRDGDGANGGNFSVKIRGLKTDLSEIDRQLHSASLARDAESVRLLGQAYTKTQAALEVALDEWSEFAD